MFATRIDKSLIKSLKLLSVFEDKPINSLLEEAIQNLLSEYDKKRPSTFYQLVSAEEQKPYDGDKTKKKRSDK